MFNAYGDLLEEWLSIDAGDSNCNGTCNVSDAVFIINYVFIGGYVPCDTNGDDIPDCWSRKLPTPQTLFAVGGVLLHVAKRWEPRFIHAGAYVHAKSSDGVQGYK